MKKIISVLILLSLILTLFACGNREASQENTDSDASSDGFLPEIKNWNGETVNILGYDGFVYSSIQIDTDSLNDNPVNNGVFNRNELIKSKYGIDINVAVPKKSEDPIKLLRADISSGLNEYQGIVCPIAYLAPLAVEGLLTDFASLDNGYIHLDKPWWDQYLINDICVNNKVFFLAGDALIEDDEATFVIYFNKDLLAANKITENPYELVKDGKWTVDKMHEMIQSVETGTVKGDRLALYCGSLSKGGYQWGMVSQTYDLYLHMQSGNRPLVDNTGDVPVIRINEQENIDAFIKLTEIFYDKKYVVISDEFGRFNGCYYHEEQIFAVGNALFMTYDIDRINMDIMQEAEINYGILPLPKLDSQQKNYASPVSPFQCSVFAVPHTNVEKLDVTCYALEAMAFYGKKLVTPEYYNRILTLRRYEDKDSAEMLDIIFNNKTYDMGGVFNFHGGDGNGTLYFYTDLVGHRSYDVMYYFNKSKENYQKGLDDFISRCYN